MRENDIMQRRNGNSPHGVAGPLPDPVRHRAILLQSLAQLALDDKRLVGTLHNGALRIEPTTRSQREAGKYFGQNGGKQ